MFGELIGAWLAERWQAMGSPGAGAPGRARARAAARLMADALRATRGVPGFHAAARPPSRRDQRSRCARCSSAALGRLQADLARRASTTCRDGPLLLVANEFFDALPVRQFEKTARGWRERMVGLADDGETLAFALAPGVTPFAAAAARRRRRRAGRDLRGRARASPAAIGARLKRDGGWALIVDYGYDGGAGASLQAVRGHRGAGILDRPGETDLSAHVDFAALARSDRRADLRPGRHRAISCAGWESRGVRETLKARAQRAQRAADRCGVGALDRPDQMGTLFRVLAVGDDRSAAPAGFSDRIGRS